MSYRADYRLAAERATAVLEDAGITKAPVYLANLMKRYKAEIKLVPYSKLMREEKLFLDEVKSMFDSDLGTSVFLPAERHYIIYFNDEVRPEIRRFTIAHEYGHILLGHHEQADESIISRETIPQEEYQEYEYEANAFARHLLAPAPLAFSIIDDRDSRYTQVSDLKKAFNLTTRAAEVRLDCLERDLRLYDDKMLDYVSTLQMKYDRTCSKCKSVVPKKASFCTNCGSKHWRKKYDHKPLPPRVRYNARGQFERCVQCGNTEISAKENYCRICNAPVVNYCYGKKDPMIGVSHINPSNALYCGRCGCETMFQIGHELKK